VHDGIGQPDRDQSAATTPPADQTPEHNRADSGHQTRRRFVRAAMLGGVGVAAACTGLVTATVVPGIIGLAAAAGGLLGAGACAAAAWRMVRGDVRALLGIAEALETYDGGEYALSALNVIGGGAFGAGWNRLIADQDRSRADWRASSLDRRSSNGAGGQASGLAGAVDAMSQGLLVVDEDLRITHVNGAAAVLLGVARDAATGQLLGAMGLPGSVVDSIRLVVGGKRGRDATELVRGEGAATSVLRVSSRRVRRSDGGDALVLLEDITQQKVAEEARHAMLAQAVHELRTPLTTIRLNVEMAIGSDESDVETRSTALDVVNQEARRLERVVNEMLSVSEMESGAFEVRADDVRLDIVFEELRSDYAAQASAKGIDLSFELPPKWPVAKADREKLTVALHNLIANALKYTPTGGSVLVRVDTDERTLTVEVEDTGIGISAEEQERVFERFYRASDGRVSNIAGSGLGLATAREIARRHGGDITVRSAVDQGSVFTLRVPIAEGATSTPAATGEERKAA